MDTNSQKLLQFSKVTYLMLYFPLFGYTLNPDLYLLWLAFLAIGGWVFLFKNRLIKKSMKTKITLIETLTTLALIVLIFSDLMPIVKQLILLITITFIVYRHTKLIYAGKLT